MSKPNGLDRAVKVSRDIPDDRVFRKKIQQFVENKRNIDHLVGSDHYITEK